MRKRNKKNKKSKFKIDKVSKEVRTVAGNKTTNIFLEETGCISSGMNAMLLAGRSTGKTYNMGANIYLGTSGDTSTPFMTYYLIKRLQEHFEEKYGEAIHIDVLDYNHIPRAFKPTKKSKRPKGIFYRVDLSEEHLTSLIHQDTLIARDLACTIIAENLNTMCPRLKIKRINNEK